jgi:hypothetical protein
VGLAWAFILILVIAALGALLFALLTAPGTPCSSIDAETITEETVEVLRAEGWYSTQADDLERLYSPGCLTPGRGV